MTGATKTDARTPKGNLDVVIVGAGFAGLYMLHKALSLGFSARVIEAGADIGGVWFFNRYPGARCDVESVDYSYSFSENLQQEWHWPERYAAQPDILRYIHHVADRFELWPHIDLNTRVDAAAYDELGRAWTLTLENGEQVRAQFCVMATGALSVPRTPEIAGLPAFRGPAYHTATWPDEEISFTGLRVGVIGTGSSGTQVMPVVAEQAGHVYVFQRTANFTVPAQNGPMEPEYEQEIKATYAERRRRARETASGLYRDISRQSVLEVSPAERERVLEENWRTAGFGFIQSFSDIILNQEANRHVVEFIHRKIKEDVDDDAVARALCPDHHPFGTKRPCVASDYYATFNRDNVTLVDLRRSPIERFTPGGVRTADGDYALDMVIFATGFDAMTGAQMKIDIRGRGGRRLRDKWAEGPRTYLGLATSGFPNLFTIAGPGSPSVLSNVMAAIEQHVDWIGDLLEYARRQQVRSVEATCSAEDAWVEHVNEMAAATLYPTADSWYLGANVPGKPRVFMPYPGGLRRYRHRCAAVAAASYTGFTLSRVGYAATAAAL